MASVERTNKPKAALPLIGVAFAFAISFAPFEARGWSDEVFADFLKQGGWHENADDNIKGENLSAELIQRIITKYRAQPDDRDAQEDMGLFALAMGVAEWGVADPAGLPPDPKDKNWASDTGIDSGKHLMSYAVGGIGISHADVGNLEDFIKLVAGSDIVPMEHRQPLLRLANKNLYKPRKEMHEVIYDETIFDFGKWYSSVASRRNAFVDWRRRELDVAST